MNPPTNRQLLSLIWLPLAAAAVQVVDDVQFAQVLFRHGDRAAIHTYPNDKAGEKVWPDGFGSLTRRGFQQQYDLGTFLRARYSALLPQNDNSAPFDERQIRIRSSGKSRCLRSAAANAAALFRPAAKSLQWNATDSDLGELWQPIAVESTPMDDDRLLMLADCPRREQLLEPDRACKTPALRRIIEDSLPMWQEVARRAYNRSGFDKSYAGLNCTEIRRLRDTFLTHQLHSIAWPSWMNDTIFERMSAVRRATYKTYDEPELARLSGGALLNAMLVNMRKKINATTKSSLDGEEEDPFRRLRIFLYSAHDSTVIGLLAAMRLVNETDGLPTYASTVFVELLKNESVRVLFKHDVDKILTAEPELLTLAGCGRSCSLDSFQGLLSAFTTSNWTAECQLHAKPIEPSSGRGLFYVLLAVICIAVSIGGLMYYRRWKHTQHDREMSALVWDEEL